jgi:uncharacterized protein (DUF58 family)
VGALWFLLAPLQDFFFWIGLLHNLSLVALVGVDLSWLRAADRVTARRELTVPLSLGEPNRVSVKLIHRGGSALRAEIRDEPPYLFQINRKELAIDLKRGETAECLYSVTPLERGSYQFGALNVRFVTLLKLLVLQRRFALETDVKVYPNIFATRKYKLLAQRRQLTQMGLRPTRLRGTGLEFESLRGYVPGDEPRHIDWKASARKQSLITRQYDVERSRHLILLLDAGRTMASRGEGLSKLDHAVNAAMLLSYVAVQHDDRIGLMTFADELLTYLAPGKGAAQLDHVMESLYALQPRRVESDYRRAFLAAAQRIRKRALILLFTDLIDPDSSERIIRHITPLLRNHLVLCVALSDYEWVDLIRATPQDTSELYRQAVAVSILEDRKSALAKLSARGVLTLDATPTDLSVAVVNRYLKIKREALL